MKVSLVSSTIIIVATSITVFSNPVLKSKVKSKFFLESLPKGITISRVRADDQDLQPAPNYSIRFVPLITLLSGFFPNFFGKLGQFNGVNKYVNTRRKMPIVGSDLAAPSTTQQNVTTSTTSEHHEIAEDDEFESELIECDADHLGLWPDKSDNQRYYKCEMDPKISATAICIKGLFHGKYMDQTDRTSLEQIEVPGVKPCFLLSMLKCANGFKYQHKTRICVPDIVFAS